MEVAGVVLGVAPLLAMTVEQYVNLYRLLKRFKKCREGVLDLLECLETQRIIFQNETMLLLTPIFGANTAKAMAEDAKHPSWSDSSKKLDSMLGNSTDSLRNTTTRIYHRMNSLEKDLTDLSKTDEVEEHVKRKISVRKRFKYTFSEQKLSELAKGIRRATKDFRILRTQVQELVTSKPIFRHLQDPRSSEQTERVKITQTAAKRIYEALSKACTLHIQHQAHFSLRPLYGNANIQQGIKFKMAFHQSQQSQNTQLKSALWFVVETLRKDPTSGTPSVCSGIHPKRPASPARNDSQKVIQRQTKRVRFEFPDPVSTSVAVSNPLMTTFCLPSQPSVSMNKNFCTYLRANCNSVDGKDGLCIGLLEDSAEWRLPVYSSIPPIFGNVDAKEGALQSLSSLFAPSDRERYKLDSTPMVKRLQCAKLISQAVLNFQATPWMRSPWSSKDIVLCDKAIKNCQGDSKDAPELFVSVPIRQVSDDDDQTATFVPPFIHNDILYNLGVVLLELAHEQPLQHMRCERDETSGLHPSMADCYTAFRQARETNSFLGPKYSEIVRKCLYCDFGQGCDLKNPSLQDAVHREVVSELDRLESGLRELTIG